MKVHSWITFAAVSIIFWLLPADALREVDGKENPSKFWSDWKKISEINPGLHAKLKRRGRQYDFADLDNLGDIVAKTVDEESNGTALKTDAEQPVNESLKTNQLYAAAFLVENYLKLLPDESMLENMICKQVQSRQATRGIWDMLDFYSILGDFWEKHGSQYEDLDWFTMYDTYSDNVAFEKMFKKKEKEVRVIWSGEGLPTRDQMKSIVQNLNKHPEKTEQIDAAVQILLEFSKSVGRTKMSQLAMPHTRSALVIAKQAMEEGKTGCKDMKETEHKDKTLQDTELIWSIGKAIACVLCGVLTPGLCDVACKITL